MAYQSSYVENSLAIKSTRFFMRLAGFWISNDAGSKKFTDAALYYTIVQIIGATFVSVQDAWFSRHDFSLAAYAVSTVTTVVVIDIKMILFLIQRDSMFNLIRFCHENYWEPTYDAFGKSILNQCEKRCGFFVLTFTVLASSTVIGYITRPIIENIGKNESERILAITVWMDLPLAYTPYFEITYVVQLLVIVHAGVCYFCFDNFLCIMNVHTAGQFQILQRRFELLCNISVNKKFKDTICKVSSADSNESRDEYVSPYDQYNELKSCVQKHQLLINFVEMIEDVYTVVILAQVTIFSLLICLVSYVAVLADGPLTMRMIFIIHSLGTFTQLFMFTLTCDDLIKQSDGVADAAYKTKWYCNLSDPIARTISKDLMMVMMRSRRPCYLSGAGFFPVSLETFTTILSTALSYLTLLRQSQDDA